MRTTSPLLYQLLGIFLPLITTNCAVLGVALLNVDRSTDCWSRSSSASAPASASRWYCCCSPAMRERLARRRARPLPGRADRPDHRRPDVARLHGLRRTGRAVSGSLLLDRAAGRCTAGRWCSGGALGWAASRLRADDSTRSSTRSMRCCRRPSAASAAIPAAGPMRRPSPAARRTSTCARPAARRRRRRWRNCSAATTAGGPATAHRSRAGRVDRRGRLHRLHPCLQACPVDAIVGAPRAAAHRDRRAMHRLRTLPGALPGRLHRVATGTGSITQPRRAA